MSAQPLSFGLNSEFDPIRAVLLHQPGREVAGIKNSAAIQHVRPIDAATLDKEYRQFLQTFKNLDIRTFLIDPKKMGEGDDYLYNLMYARDLLFMTPKGAVLCRMAGNVRGEEILYAERALKKIGAPVIGAIQAPGLFEGADALWLNKETVLVGIGNRTNEEGLAQLAKVLQAQKVKTLSVPVPANIQHLLGIVQFVDKDLALVRTDIADPEIKKILGRAGVQIVDIPESAEVTQGQAMNILTVAPRKIVMAANCPKTRKIYEAGGVEVATEVSISQLINGGGGVGCATSILSRSPA